MANHKATTLLTSLPLEVRHHIFEYTAARQTKPKKLLRYWFEKKEAKELVAKHVADNPNDPAPRVVYHQDREVDSDVPEAEAAEEEDDESEDNGDEDAENEEDEENGQDDDDGGAEDDEADQDGEELDDVVNTEGNEEEDEIMEEDGNPHITGTSQASTSTPAQSLHPEAASATHTHAQQATDDQHDEADPVVEQDRADDDITETQDGDGDEVTADEDGHVDVDDDEGEEGNEDEHGTDAAAAAGPPAAVDIYPSQKWRHIPNFMRLSQCPPPVELLLASKQLNEEAKHWFYDVAVLRISATSSFAHTSFFEEAFSQIAEAAFSPMENIRKVEVLFVWDTTWIRAEETGSAEAIFPALLRQRADFVHQILSQAPDLHEVTIHWHDSAQDNESANMMLDILAPFHSLNAAVQIKEHYIAANAKPHKKSIAGQRRLEFQHIFDAGLDRLF